MRGNKILHIFLTLALIFTMCTPVAIKAETTFQVISPISESTVSKNFTYYGGTCPLVVIPSDNSVWTAYPSASWIKTNKTTGAASNPAVEITVESNKQTASRSGKVVFSTGSASYTFTIYQAGNPTGKNPDTEPTILNVQYTSLQAPSYGQNYFINVGSNRAWTAYSTQSWIYYVDRNTYHGGAGSCVAMYIGVKPNTTGKQRVGQIIVKGENVTKTITITQSA